MREMHVTVADRLGDERPNIALVNWNSEASPTKMLRFETGYVGADMLADVAAIRTQAREVGDTLAFRLFQLVAEKKIDPAAPVQFIGHSAGGFVVARAALILREMDVLPGTLRVTILDTPGADYEVMKRLPDVCDVEFYVTSPFLFGSSDSEDGDPLYMRKKVSSEKLSPLEKHSYAHQWYLRSIREDDPDGDGFARSPFSRPREK
jgi:pimeloyl-ACP methyl ester carboxylesterase